MTLVIGIDKARPQRFPCRLYHCEATAAADAIMCRKHWRVVPVPLQVAIRREIRAATQVDPRANSNASTRWRILCSKAQAAVLQAQGKADAMNDELDRLARLDPKSAHVLGATTSRPSKHSSRSKSTDANAGS